MAQFNNPYLEENHFPPQNVIAALLAAVVAFQIYNHAYMRGVSEAQTQGDRKQASVRRIAKLGALGQPLGPKETPCRSTDSTNSCTLTSTTPGMKTVTGSGKEGGVKVARNLSPYQLPPTGRSVVQEKELKEAHLRWGREQALQRLERKGTSKNAAKRLLDTKKPSYVAADTAVLPAAPQKSGEYSARIRPKKTRKIKLPEPERFAPKVVLSRSKMEGEESPPILLCQPVVEEQEGNNPDAHAAPGPGERLQAILNAGAGKKSKELENATVSNDGKTRYLHVPYLPNADHTSFMLKRLAKEFTPIIKRRKYTVLWVSEMCCCSDGAKAAQGEGPRKQRIKVQTTSGSEDLCGGYNRTMRVAKDKTMHLIHIRLRDRINHYKFKDYNTVANTMAHELAHCQFQNHSPEFYKLMGEIKKEHQELLSSGSIHKNENAVEQFGFDIYGSSTLTSRF